MYHGGHSGGFQDAFIARQRIFRDKKLEKVEKIDKLFEKSGFLPKGSSPLCIEMTLKHGLLPCHAFLWHFSCPSFAGVGSSFVRDFTTRTYAWNLSPR